MAQPDDHPPAGGLLHHLLTLTPDWFQLYLETRLGGKPAEAVIFFCVAYRRR